MHGRGTGRPVAAIRAIAGASTLVVCVLVLLFGSFTAHASVDDEPPPDRPPSTVSDFYPEENNLSDCVGLVEKPGCGSESRGGWRQTLVFGVVAVGLAFIIWRITAGIRRNSPERPNRS